MAPPRPRPPATRHSRIVDACTACSIASCSHSSPERTRRRRLLFAAMGVLVLAAAGLVAVKAVVLKMLPFDNKSEFQIVLDMPEGSTLERTNQLLAELAGVIDRVPEVANYQGYAGTAAPITFNG